MHDAHADSTLSLTYLASLESVTKLQSNLSKLIYQHKIDNIKSSWNTQDINRLYSCSHEGGILITALPTYKDFRITTPHLFRERLLTRLGLPYYAIPCGPCRCNPRDDTVVDPQGYHLLSVCKLGNQRQATHNAVVAELSLLFSHAGLTTRKEDSEIIKMVNMDSSERVDLTCDNFQPGVPLSIDVAVTDPRQLRDKSPCQGKAASVLEKVKRKHYGPIYEKAGAIFSPFVVESFGRWGNCARQLFDLVIQKMHIDGTRASSSLPKPWLVHYWRSRITMALHRQACIGIHKRITSLILWKRGIKCDDNPSAFVEMDDPCSSLLAFQPLLPA
jgi:hypothetical protein